MPQREFWTEAHPVEVRWRYATDLTLPEGPGQLAITVYDQAGKMMEHGAGVVPFETVHEGVLDALGQSWEGFLFGGRHDGPRALKLALTRAERDAKARRRAQFG